MWQFYTTIEGINSTPKRRIVYLHGSRRDETSPILKPNFSNCQNVLLFCKIDENLVKKYHLPHPITWRGTISTTYNNDALAILQ